MLRTFWIASTGMQSQQLNLDVIANNLANVNTVGYKKSRTDFQELLYQEETMPGAASSPDTQVPTGLQIGLGVRPVSTEKIFSEGNLEQTSNPLDLAVEGEGFFKILLPSGEVAYTRSGSFKVDSEGRIVTATGYPLDPETSVPEDTREVFISADGILSVTQGDSNVPTEIGSLELARFVNPGGLRPMGQNLFLATTASGDEVTGVPGEDGMGTVAQGFLEMSNVNVVEEMVNMIISQRAYEINSKAIQSADQMLQMLNNLKV
ncbi:MAG: flagellar basal-body rod protein FlgG [bacterium]